MLKSINMLSKSKLHRAASVAVDSVVVFCSLCSRLWSIMIRRTSTTPGWKQLFLRMKPVLLWPYCLSETDYLPVFKPFSMCVFFHCHSWVCAYVGVFAVGWALSLTLWCVIQLSFCTVRFSSSQFPCLWTVVVISGVECSDFKPSPYIWPLHSSFFSICHFHSFTWPLTFYFQSLLRIAFLLAWKWCGEVSEERVSENSEARKVLCWRAVIWQLSWISWVIKRWNQGWITWWASWRGQKPHCWVDKGWRSEHIWDRNLKYERLVKYNK